MQNIEDAEIAARAEEIRTIVEETEPYWKLIDLEDETNTNFLLEKVWAVSGNGVAYLEYDSQSPAHEFLHTYLQR